eukprot:968874_1
MSSPNTNISCVFTYFHLVSEVHFVNVCGFLRMYNNKVIAAAFNGTNLVDASAGAVVLFATDEFFATADNLIKNTEPIFDPNAYCAQGKVMDGWESRRRREPGHDWCIIRLAYPGVIHGVEVDTAYFTGNHVPKVSIQGATITEPNFDLTLPGCSERLNRGGGIQGTKASSHDTKTAQEMCKNAAYSSGGWCDILPITPLKPGYPETRKQRFYSTCGTKSVTHIRINYFPDGGVARIKLFGDVSLNFEREIKGKYLDLACAMNGGKGIGCSNQHYGEPSNLIKAQRGVDMRDGWETARHPDRPAILQKDPVTGLVKTDLMDWCVIKLGAVIECVDKLIVDTAHFKGNYPESCMVEACYQAKALDEFVCQPPGKDQRVGWFVLLKRTKLSAHAQHTFQLDKNELRGKDKCVSHVRLSIYPDGGVSRVRVFGIGKEPITPLSIKSRL